MQNKSVFTPRKDGDIALSFGVTSKERTEELIKKLDQIQKEETAKGIDQLLGCRVVDRISNEVGETDEETHYAIFQAGVWFEHVSTELNNPFAELSSQLSNS